MYIGFRGLGPRGSIYTTMDRPPNHNEDGFPGASSITVVCVYIYTYIYIYIGTLWDCFYICLTVFSYGLEES